MRRLSALVPAALLVVALAACTSGGAPGWTYAPAPSVTAAPSGGASGAPGASGSPAASAPASAPASTAPSSGTSAAPSGAANTLEVEAPSGAATSGFVPTTLTATANTAFTIHFKNEDSQPHNVELKDANGTAVALGGDTQFFTGPGERDYQVPALAAGSYTYFCVVHPTTMTGTLTVQ